MDDLIKGQKALERGQEILRQDIVQGQEDLNTLKGTIGDLKQGQEGLAKRQDETYQLLRALEEHVQVTRAVVTRVDEGIKKQ